jgi:hypothetical protein
MPNSGKKKLKNHRDCLFEKKTLSEKSFKITTKIKLIHKPEVKARIPCYFFVRTKYGPRTLRMEI